MVSNKPCSCSFWLSTTWINIIGRIIPQFYRVSATTNAYKQLHYNSNNRLRVTTHQKNNSTELHLVRKKNTLRSTECPSVSLTAENFILATSTFLQAPVPVSVPVVQVAVQVLVLGMQVQVQIPVPSTTRLTIASTSAY